MSDKTPTECGEIVHNIYIMLVDYVCLPVLFSYIWTLFDNQSIDTI